VTQHGSTQQGSTQPATTPTTQRTRPSATQATPTITPAPQRRQRPVTVIHLPALAADTDSARARLAVVRAAAEQLGWPYIWGGDNRREGGFDCSGLVDYAYHAAGYTLPGRPTAAVLWRMSTPIAKDELRAGDLVFLGAPSGDPYHVALYAGSGLVIVAPRRGEAVMVVPLDSVAWDGFGRLWAPGGKARLDLSQRAVHKALAIVHRKPRVAQHDRAADRRAADRVAHALKAAATMTIARAAVRLTGPAAEAALTLAIPGESAIERRRRTLSLLRRRGRRA
jgi:cell wall-associated NlpC family hydrolase